MQAIILSAGRGKRLSKWISYPKCLIKLNSKKTLIDRILELLHKEGINDIHIVTGFKSNLIKKKLKRKVKYHFFKDYNKYNNLQTLLSVKKLLNKESIILFSDIIFDREILKKVKSKYKNIVLAIKTDKVLKDTMRVKIKNNKITDIGNQIKPKFADGNFIGIAKFSKEYIKILKNYLIKNKENKNDYYTKALIDMIQNGFAPNYININKFFWKEIDTIKDLNSLSGIKLK